MPRRVYLPWSDHNEAHLLLQWMLQPRGVVGRIAHDQRRTKRSVRIKLHRLLKDPDNVPLSFRDAVRKYRATADAAASTDAAAPQVSAACGLPDTPTVED